MEKNNLKSLVATNVCIIDDAPKLTVGKSYPILRWEQFTEPDTNIQDICAVIINDVEKEHYFGTAVLKEYFNIPE